MFSEIDLHMHSAASDGTDDPIQLAEKVKAAGVRVFALTDHDTVAGAALLAERLPENVAFIPGIEFSCRMSSGKCHILGYDCDTSHPAFRGILAHGAELRRAKLNKRLAFLQEERGICLPEAELERLRQLPSVGKPHLANLMVRYGHAANRQEAITEVLNLCPTQSSRISAEAAVRAILASGGVPIWAHPLCGEGEREVGREQFGAMLDELMLYGLMGLECYYSKYPMSRCETLAKAARERRLLISGGSDYHGTNKDIALGTLNRNGQAVPPERLTILNAFAERGRISI